jgi:hypothetical protein
MLIPAFSLHHARDLLPRYHVALGCRLCRMNIPVCKAFLGCLFGVQDFKSCAKVEHSEAIVGKAKLTLRFHLNPLVLVSCQNHNGKRKEY